MAKTAKPRARAFTLIEVLVASTLLTLFLVVGYSMLKMADKVFHQISGNEDATMQLRRAVRMLEQDLITTNILQVQGAKVPAHLAGGAYDGSAICMLSAALNGTGDMVSKSDGEPTWQRNILYYVITPQGDPCAGGADAQGYDDRCPHKLLIRKIIDNPAAGPEEVLFTPAASLTPYLTQPVGKTNISNLLGEANVTQVELVARGMVSMQIKLPPPQADLPVTNIPNEVQVVLTAFNEPKSRKLALGTVALSAQPGFLVNSFSVFPRNNR
ncbi:MAG: prepilin-type N-terminal cleavage/methylation domain-containing protein [Vulcanimicrobiota bacterium]